MILGREHRLQPGLGAGAEHVEELAVECPHGAAQERGVGYSSLISTGNEMAIDMADCLDSLVDDGFIVLGGPLGGVRPGFPDSELPLVFCCRIV